VICPFSLKNIKWLENLYQKELDDFRLDKIAIAPSLKQRMQDTDYNEHFKSTTY